MDSVGALWPLWAGLIAYAILRFWLPAVAKRDMDRRGQPGWVYDLAVWWILPLGLLAWWQARRRYPILDNESMKSDRRSS